MFSNLNANSILYVFDVNGTPKILSGPIEKQPTLHPKYSMANPNMEMVVDMVAIIGGERREFKGIPNGTIANFGDDRFILADSKESLSSYLSSMMQNSKNIIDSYDKHKKLLEEYEKAFAELNPSIKQDKERDVMIKSLQDQISELKNLIINQNKHI